MIRAALLIGAVVAGTAARAGALPGQSVEVRGKLTILDKGGKLAPDVADAVVWIEGASGGRPAPAEILTRDKTFIPGVVVVAPGASVSFPNHDPFNHNVFSLSEEAPFDLGLYGRGETRVAWFPKPGIARVYCNVHAQMWAVVVVVDGPLVARPRPDGSFAIAGVRPGRHTLRAWHLRGGETTLTVEVGGAGTAGVELTLDASTYKHKPHLNKFGKPYDGRRY